jgi:hypothetical protein
MKMTSLDGHVLLRVWQLACIIRVCAFLIDKNGLVAGIGIQGSKIKKIEK